FVISQAGDQGFRSRDDQEFSVRSRIDGCFDLPLEFLYAHEILPGSVTEAGDLWEMLVLDHDSRSARALVLANRVHHVDGVSKPGVDVGDDWQIAPRRHRTHHREMIRHAD